MGKGVNLRVRARLSAYLRMQVLAGRDDVGERERSVSTTLTYLREMSVCARIRAGMA